MSFFSLPFLRLPTFSSLASALPSRSEWQSRLLRYLIERTLKGILILPETGLEQGKEWLDADLSSGSVKLRNVQLDAEVSDSEHRRVTR